MNFTTCLPIFNLIKSSSVLITPWQPIQHRFAVAGQDNLGIGFKHILRDVQDFCQPFRRSLILVFKFFSPHRLSSFPLQIPVSLYVFGVTVIHFYEREFIKYRDRERRRQHESNTDQKAYPPAICPAVFIGSDPAVDLSAPVRKGVSAGLESCAAVLIPSLFPFMVYPAFWAKAGQQTAYREYWDRW